MKFEGVGVYKQMKEGKLEDYMNLSKFPLSKELYDNTRIGQLGLFKSETADIPIAEAINLAPNRYSILLDNGKENNAAKCVPQGMKRTKLTHYIYGDVHGRKIKSLNAARGRIQSRHYKLLYFNK